MLGSRLAIYFIASIAFVVFFCLYACIFLVSIRHERQRIVR